MDKRALLVTAVILLIPVLMLVIWAFQGQSMKDDFAKALSEGVVKEVHRDLQGKEWSPDELATIEVLKVPDSFGTEQAVTRALHARGRIFVSARQYEFQATVRDASTDIVHVFGYRRTDPRHWCWDGFHPDSMQVHLQRQQQRLEEMTKPTSVDGQPQQKH
jgi:hypothetical protein